MPEAVLDVTDCLARVRAGDQDAGRELIQHLYPLVIKIVRSHLPRRMDEEDLSQIVFVKIFKNLNQFRGSVPLEHWVSRVAVNSCLNELRAEKCRPEIRWADLKEEESEVMQNVLQLAPGPSPAHQCSARDLAAKLLETLAPADRMILSLLDMEENSVEEVSRITGMNQTLIKVRAFRARAKLRKQFERLEKIA